MRHKVAESHTLTSRRIITITGALSKEQRVWALNQTPSPEGPALCRWAQRMFGFKDSRAYFWGNQRTERNRESTLNGCTQNLICSRTRAEALIWKEPRSGSPADLKSPMERQQATVAHPGYTDTGTAIYGSLYYHVDTGAEKHHFESSL